MAGAAPRILRRGVGSAAACYARCMIDHIHIALYPDRARPGLLTAYAQGVPAAGFACLGRSAGDWKNPARDPLRYRGHTPTGDYARTFVSRLAKPVLGIGDLWIGLDPISGQALQAEEAGRTGLGIHGGRGDSILRMTHGCIRLFDRDMRRLAEIAGKARFTVTIDERL